MQRHVSDLRLEGRPLGLRLLHPILAELLLAPCDQRLDRIDALSLGDGDQGDIVRHPPGARLCAVDPLPDLIQR